MNNQDLPYIAYIRKHRRMTMPNSKDADTFQKITEAVVPLYQVRKRPIYLLCLDVVKKFYCIQLHKDLKDASGIELDVIIHSGGGDSHAAYLIAKTIRQHFKHVTFIVPIYAKSAATLICLSADDLILGEIAELGPLDAQILEAGESDSPDLKSALNSFKALDQIQKYTLETLDLAMKLILSRSGLRMGEAFELANQFAGSVANPLYSQINPYKVGENARSLDVGYEYAIRILERYMKYPPQEAKEIAEKLVRGYPAHDFILDVDELNRIGLKAHLADEKIQAVIEEIKYPLLETEESLMGFVPCQEAGKTARKEEK